MNEQESTAPPPDRQSGPLWQIRDFAKRYRLEAQEEIRLQKLHGQTASLNVLLATARRY